MYSDTRTCIFNVNVRSYVHLMNYSCIYSFGLLGYVISAGHSICAFGFSCILRTLGNVITGNGQREIECLRNTYDVACKV